jgi:carbonic anhydrase
MTAILKSSCKDLPASLVVNLLALPLCLGTAFASWATLFSGMIFEISSGIDAGILTSSQLSLREPGLELIKIVAFAITNKFITKY